MAKLSVTACLFPIKPTGFAHGRGIVKNRAANHTRVAQEEPGAAKVFSREEEEYGVKKFWLARGRGGKEAREEEKEVQTNRQELTIGLGKGKN